MEIILLTCFNVPRPSLLLTRGSNEHVTADTGAAVTKHQGVRLDPANVATAQCTGPLGRFLMHA